jgi:hypothetical protein
MQIGPTDAYGLHGNLNLTGCGVWQRWRFSEVETMKLGQFGD